MRYIIKAYLDGLVDGTENFGDAKNFKEVAGAINPVSLTVYGYDSTNITETIKDARLYLLSTKEAKKIPISVRMCSDAIKDWWLRSPYRDYDKVQTIISDGTVLEQIVNTITIGVRPALQLDLASVVFSTETRKILLPQSITAPM